MRTFSNHKNIYCVTVSISLVLLPLVILSRELDRFLRSAFGQSLDGQYWNVVLTFMKIVYRPRQTVPDDVLIVPDVIFIVPGTTGRH